MNISHELPLSLLKYSSEWNDYEYCLPHLIDKYKEYKEHFLQAKKDNRFIIMDNGLFEGISHTNKDLREKINLINPSIFIIPDEWNSSQRTYRNAEKWIRNFKQEISDDVQLMVVMQGKDILEFMELYQKCEDLGITHFAFNHSSISYQNLFTHPNKLINQMMGRLFTVGRMKDLGYIKEHHYIHLLGCSLPQELIYHDKSIINSVDTSNPIICGALGNLYEPWGLLYKPTQRIEEFFEKDLFVQIPEITFNLQIFRDFTK